MAKQLIKSEPPDLEDILKELNSDEEKAGHYSEGQLVDKYEKGQARIITQRNDFLIPNILQMLNDREWLDLNPSYQRRGRWNESKRALLIESLLMNIPIPPIFLYERSYARYEVMDGQQRLNALKAFWNNGFKLKNLKKWPELNDKYFKELPKQIQAGLERRSLSAVIVLTESGQDPVLANELRQYVFERLNTGGVPLNAQEVRNCIYASKFSELLIEISRSKLFTTVWDIPAKEKSELKNPSKLLEQNGLYSTMADCEIVLRFFALQDMSKFQKGMKKSLDSYMSNARSFTDADCKKMKEEYLSALEVARSIYGDSTFRLIKGNALTGRRSVPLADAVLLAVNRLQAKANKLISNKELIIKKTLKLLSKKESYDALVGRGNTKKAVEERIDIVNRMLASVLGGK